MSYGYQGPPIPYDRNKPPSAFGAPPGAPSAPGAPPQPYSNYSYQPPNQPPASFGMPQPYSPYTSPAYPPTAMPMPMQEQPHYSPSHNAPPQPFPRHQGMPQPDYAPPQPSGMFPNPSQHHQPGPYPGHQQPGMYPGSMQPPQAYPRNIPSNPYPDLGQADNSFPSHMRGGMPPPSSRHSPFGDQMNTSSSAAPYPRAGGLAGGHGPGSYSSDSYAASPMGQHAPQRHSQAPQGRPMAKLSPTVVAHGSFDSRADAEVLRKAMKGIGTDEKAIISVLANRNNLQRQEIADQFKTLYGKDLLDDLKSEVSGNFKKLVVAMMTPLPQYYAKELHEAMSGVGTDECVLIEVMCTMSNHEIRVIKQAYSAMYGRTLEDDLIGDTSGGFKRLMVSLCCANRDESFDVNPAAAVQDAKALLQAGELRFGTDESAFNAILVQRSAPQLQAIFREYENLTGHSIEDAMENEFSGDIKKGLLAIVECVKNRPAFFAKQLYKSMKGMGTDDQRLIRLAVTRSEIDMGEIKQEFQRQYNQSLESFISDDCSGHYKKCLIALIS